MKPVKKSKCSVPNFQPEGLLNYAWEIVTTNGVRRSLAFLLVGLFLLIGMVKVGAQSEVRMTHYGKDKGFYPQGAIADIRTDKDNNIWIILFNMIIRYDGRKFKRLLSGTAEHGLLLRFYESANGEPYVVDKFNQVFFIEGDTLRAYHMNDTLKKLSKNSIFSDIYFDRDDCLHVSNRSYGYLTIDSNSKIRYPLVEAGIPVYGVSCFLMEDREPFIVVGHYPMPDNETRSFSIFNEKKELVNKSLQLNWNYFDFPCQTKLRSGNFLLSTGKGDLIEYNESGFIKKHPYEEPILGLMTDKHGNIWLSAKGSGVYFYKDGIISFDNSERIVEGPYAVASAEDFQGGIWLYSPKKGLARIGAPGFRYYSKVFELRQGEGIRAISLNDGHLNLGLYNGVFGRLNLQEGGLVRSKPNESSKQITDLYHDPFHSRTWLTQRGSVMYALDDEWKELSLDKIAAETKGAMESKLYYFSGTSSNDSGTFVLRSGLRFFFISDTTVNYVSPEYPHKILSVLYHGDSVWVATEGGVYLQLPDTIIDLKQEYPELGATFYQMVYFNDRVWMASRSRGILIWSRNGLKPLKVGENKLIATTFIHRGSNELWAKSSGGVFCFSKEGKKNHFTGTHFSAFAKFPPTGNWAWAVDSTSIYTLETRTSVLKADFDQIRKRAPRTPHLLIKEVEINNKRQSIGDSTFALEYNSNYVQLSYVGINYTIDGVKYRYRMPGAIDGWKETEETSLQFIQLPPGEYEFEIQAQIKMQAWGIPQKLHFSIAPPYWQTWWFIGLSSLVLAGLVSWIIYMIFRVINREKNLTISRLSAEQKALRAKMDPHFVFNVISSAQYLIMAKENEKAIQFLQIFARLMRNVLDQSSQTSVSMENEIASLKGYMELEYFRLGENFEYTIIGAEEDLWKTEKTIPFVIQPFLENAIHHGLKDKGEQGQLTLTLIVEKDFLKVVIEDNGIGRAAARKIKTKEKAKQQSHGVQIVKDRLKLHNGGKAKNDIIIEDLQDAAGKAVGTRVTIFIKRITE